MTAFAMGPKNGVHDSKRWLIDKKGFLAPFGIVSNKNWNIPITINSRL